MEQLYLVRFLFLYNCFSARMVKCRNISNYQLMIFGPLLKPSTSWYQALLLIALQFRVHGVHLHSWFCRTLVPPAIVSSLSASRKKIFLLRTCCSGKGFSFRRKLWANSEPICHRNPTIKRTIRTLGLNTIFLFPAWLPLTNPFKQLFHT